jgi:hypothetical protein
MRQVPDGSTVKVLMPSNRRMFRIPTVSSEPTGGGNRLSGWVDRPCAGLTLILIAFAAHQSAHSIQAGVGEL